MRALFVYLLITLVSFNSFSESAPEELPPLDPAYVGEHGMVLLNKSSAVFAYHLPGYQKPHDVQLLYRLEVKNVAFLHLVRDNEMVTIKPKPFNLQRLMRGEKVAIEADVFLGHFERDGMLVYENMTINFAEQLYLRKLDDVQPSSNQQEYDVVSYRNTNKIYIHRIQQPPSYDHVIHIDVNAGCLTKFNTSSPVPKRSELQYKFFNCGTMKPLYYETQDFEIK
ncbi:hypothetical protein H4J38_00620 [Colwellia sp. BRX10-3]|uniref:hypothetical protein n=1 Tax=Colwellia sp. BRX10-3 TaxID=2759844 RepID=UPI0015F6C56A|nr:hypothetical protein [Colwellia sp. BRX10-3]MBA6389274.1 hypothetical protein [Colwellia sp. BRX10-3]